MTIIVIIILMIIVHSCVRKSEIYFGTLVALKEF